MKDKCISLLPDGLSHTLELPATAALSARQAAYLDMEIDETPCTAFIEYTERPVSLVVAGAGNDVQPLVEMAHLLGWLVTIVDGRQNYIDARRFPNAKAVLFSRAQDILPQLKTDDQTVFLLMSHNYNYDLGF